MVLLFTGVQFLNGDALVTTSVDQRLNVWSYDPQAATLKLTSSFAHDVADATSLQVLSNRFGGSVCNKAALDLDAGLWCMVNVLSLFVVGTRCVLCFVVLEFNTVL